MNFTPGRETVFMKEGVSCPAESLAFPLKLFIKHLFPPKKQNFSPGFFIKCLFSPKKQNSSTNFFIKRLFSLKKQNFSAGFFIKCLFSPKKQNSSTNFFIKRLFLPKIQNFPAIFFINLLFSPKKQNFSGISLKCSGSCNSFSTPPHHNINDCISLPNPLYLESLRTQPLLPSEQF